MGNCLQNIEEEQTTENELDDTLKNTESDEQAFLRLYSLYSGFTGILGIILVIIIGILTFGHRRSRKKREYASSYKDDSRGYVEHSCSKGDSPERDVILAARTSIQLPPLPPPPAPPPPEFLDDINAGNPQHFNHPAIHEHFEYGHNAVQLAVPDPLPHQHPAPPPPPDLLD